MKKLLCVTIALLCTATMQAQEEEKDVTKFLGIPVDGYKPAMIEPTLFIVDSFQVIKTDMGTI